MTALSRRKTMITKHANAAAQVTRMKPSSIAPMLLLMTLVLSFTVTNVSGNDATPPGGTIPNPNVTIEGGNRDQFTYGETKRGVDGGNNVYGPKDWASIDCPNSDICLGYADKFRNSQGWEIDETNHCMSCPFENKGSCGNHHNSPTNLERNRAINESSYFNACVDPHWMEYRDSSCTFEELRSKNAFTIERHAVRITQPTNWYEYMAPDSKVYKIDCLGQYPDKRRAWGIIDFPRGYSDWYYLSHIDFKVPSEHYQEGVGYDGEIQLKHFYSVTPEVAGVHNQAGTVAIMMKVVDRISDWPELNKVICAWREAEDKVREDCGLPSVELPYPGCTPYSRGAGSEGSSTTTDVNDNNTIATQGASLRKLQQETHPTRKAYRPAKSMMDIVTDHEYESFLGNKPPKEFKIDHHNSSIDLEEFDWDAFIAEEYKNDERAKKQKRNKKQRRLLNYADVKWFNYFPMIKVRTEYYFRYEGSQTEPPCYGKFVPNGDRINTVAWRVMKDPILVSQRQINEIHRLLKYRIAPKGNPINSCKPDTAAGPDPDGDPNKITVARPLQSQSTPHFTTFCECANWKSKWIEDNEWCKDWKHTTKQGRFYERPYNFKTNLSSFV